MIRSWIKTNAATALSCTRMDRLIGSFSGFGSAPVVIGYHRVVEDFTASVETSIPSMLTSRQTLEQHLDWIGRRFRFISLDELGDRLESGEGRTEPLAAVTFDDGYRDFYYHALPVLKQRRVPATVFVVTDLVGTAEVQHHDKLYLLLAGRLGRRPWTRADLEALLKSIGAPLSAVNTPTPFSVTRALIEALPQAELERIIRALEAQAPIRKQALQPFFSLTWKMLDEILDAGMSVGSHTRTHVLLTNETAPRAMEEAVGSRQILESRLGIRVRHFAYPSGRFNTDAVRAVANAGYQFAYTTCGHRDARHPSLTVPRALLWENACRDSRGKFSGAILSCQVHGAFQWFAGCRQRHTLGPGGGNG